MPVPLVAAAGIAGLTSLVSGGLNYMGQKKANQTNIDLQREKQRYDRQMWDLQNAYNTPTAQMERLKSAGLNPNLVYGSGNVSGTVSSRPQAHAATVTNELQNVIQGNPLNVLQAYTDYQAKKAQIDNINANTQLIESKDLNEKLRSPILRTQFGQKSLDLSQGKKLAGTQISSAEANLNRLRLQNQKSGYYNKYMQPKELQLLKSNQGIRQLEHEMQSNLKPYNMSVSDSAWLRIGMQLLKQFGGVKPMKLNF